MNAPDMLFLCNEAASGRTGSTKGLAKLRTVGSGKNVRLELDDVGRQLNQNIPAALIDLVEIAALVYVADQMEHCGANDVEGPLNNPPPFRVSKKPPARCVRIASCSGDDARRRGV